MWDVSVKEMPGMLDVIKSTPDIIENTSNDYTKKLESGFTHIAFNFMTKKEMPQGTEYNIIEDEFLRKKAFEGLQASREILPSEELTLVYSTF